MAKYRNEKQVTFYDLDGENRTLELKSFERLLDIQCPLDGTYLIYDSAKDSFPCCPCCEIVYPNLDSKDLIEQLKNEIISSKERLKNLKEKQSKLEKFLAFVEKHKETQ